MKPPRVISSSFLIFAFLTCLAGASVRPESPSGGDQEETRQGGRSREEVLRDLREKRRENLTPYEVRRGEERARRFETQRSRLLGKGYYGFRALIGGIDDPARFGQASSGAGLAGGVGYQQGLESEAFRFRLEGRYSTKSYESLRAVAEFPTQLSDSPVKGFVSAAFRDYKEIDFFGLGNLTSRDGEASYRLQDRRLGAGVQVVPNRFLFFEAGWTLLNTHVLSGSGDISVEDRFDVGQEGDLAVLGRGGAPEYHIYAGTAGFNLFDSGFPEAGAGVMVSVERYDDRDSLRYNFTRISGEFSSEIPLGYRNRRVAFRLRTVHHLADAGNEVPFYLQETLGGGTSLRGFRNYRFRDRRSLLMNLEYRWEVWTYADFAIFTDAGKVFRKAGDLDFSDLETGYGFGLLVRAPFQDALGRFGRLRIDLARSREGVQIHIGSGPGLGRRLLPGVR